jgi:hypothetical protein
MRLASTVPRIPPIFRYLFHFCIFKVHVHDRKKMIETCPTREDKTTAGVMQQA